MLHRLRRLLPVLVPLLLGPVAAGATEPAFPPAVVRQLDQAVDAAIATQKLPGVAVGIWVPGQGVYRTARGAANLATGRPRHPGDPFRIASVTKTFIATAILQLVDQGKLRKSDPLAKWYPGFPNARLITVDDLLQMRSGIADAADSAFLSWYYDHRLTTLGAEAMIRRSARRAGEFKPPGGKVRYNNTNYIILGEIIAKVSGRSLPEQLRKTIFAPLGMSDTVYPEGPDLPGLLHGYSLDDTTHRFVDVTRVNPAPAGGAGAIISTLDDLHVYARAVCTGRLLKPATQAARLRGKHLLGAPDFARYGDGIELLGPLCGHNGTIFGFSTEMFYLPAKDAVIVINVNRLDEDDQSQSSALLVALTRILFPDRVPW